MEKSAMAPRKILIKKYENRRLYDATNSHYVNLEEVAQFVQRGDDVQVVDAASGEDITRLILTQIIAEGAKTPDSSFPLDFLRQMVIASGRVSQESASRYTKAMLDLYQSTYRAMAPALNPFEFMQNAGAPTAPAPGKAEDEAEPRVGRKNGRESEEVNHLKARVAELEKLVSSIVSETSPPKKAARKRSGRKR
jgi:polyhydroxyalkanoate synthesis repressor PhaR